MLNLSDNFLLVIFDNLELLAVYVFSFPNNLSCLIITAMNKFLQFIIFIQNIISYMPS